MTRAVVACVGLALAAALLPGAASAATVTRDASGALTYTAGAGRTNQVDVQQTGGEITFYTSGDLMSSIPAGCAQSDIWPGEVVTCGPPSAVRVSLGDGDDRGVVSTEVSVPVAVSGGPGSDLLDGNARPNTLDGGSGDDRLNGGEGDDVLVGGDGSDDLQGKAGRDRLYGGAGDDLLHPDGHEGASADVVDGGPGVDAIDDDYSSRFSDVDPPLSITLAGAADDGRPGEGDNLVNVEKIEVNVAGRYVGGAGADEFRIAQITGRVVLIGAGGGDRLRGADGPDRLEGGPGDDALDAGFGDDAIIGGPGRDTISGDLAGGDCGPFWCKEPYGNDTIEAVDGEVDSVSCGAGTDVVRADAADVVAPDCETVVRAGAPNRPAGPATRPRLALATHRRLAAALRRGLSIRVTGADPGRRFTLTARRRTTVVARGAAKIRADGRATVRLRFTPKARRVLRRVARVTLAVAGGGMRLKVTVRR